MAELTPLYMDINSVYSGDELGLPYRDIMGEGVVDVNDLKVSQRAAGANLSVDVAAGACWVLGDTNPAAQPIYRCRNDAVKNLGITPDPTNPRKVIVVAQVIDETFAGSGRLWELQTIHGTPAASPAEPALPSSALKLAVVDVAAGATQIVNANITDARVRAKVGSGQAQINAGSVGYGTSLPASPVDGQEFVLVDSLTNPTYQWRFRYNAGSSSAYKWEFVGGTPAYKGPPSAGFSTTSTSYVSLTANQFTAPRPGEYLVEYVATNISGDTLSANVFVALFVNGAVTWEPYFTAPGANHRGTLATGTRITVASAGHVVGLRAKVGAGAGAADGVTMTITPIQVS